MSRYMLKRYLFHGSELATPELDSSEALCGIQNELDLLADQGWLVKSFDVVEISARDEFKGELEKFADSSRYMAHDGWLDRTQKTFCAIVLLEKG